jgi:ribonuclease R
MPKRPPPGLPTRDQIMEFITKTDQPAGKREIARAFGLHGNDKIALKSLLKDMGDEGLIDQAPGRAFHLMGGVPKVTVFRVADMDGDQVVAVPENWEAEGKPPPRLRVIERGRRSALTVNDRFLGRTEDRGAGHVVHLMKKLAKGEELILGVVQKEGDRFWLRPVDKRERRDTEISDLGEAAVGDLVLAEKTGRPPRITARVTQVLGDPFAPKSFSMIAIHKFGIPCLFSDELLTEAETVAKLPLGRQGAVRAEPVEAPFLSSSGENEKKKKTSTGSVRTGGEDGAIASNSGANHLREDLRHLPIIAIDPADARDHDDAVWAAPRDDGGFDAIVAIADVSFFVRPGSALDREARKRGNSVYFPDQVVPMLPETLSSDVCSLKQGEDRAALACHLTIDVKGRVASWRFTRAVIRVAANIAYEDAQAAIDGVKPHDLLDTALRPLWACWALLARARDAREPLDLDLPERRVVLDDKGRIASIAARERLDAHRLIEDFMIAANVAAAKALEAKKAPCMYRDHEPPAREKLVALKDYLETFGISFALGQVVKPATFNRLIAQVGDADHKPQVMEQILRSQTQAYYAPSNAGHFGLALGSYAHFTSPIRRYADLLVHRALVGAYGLGDGALTADEAARMAVIGTAISQAERRAMEAERETLDRYVAAYLAVHVGELVDTRITGVANFGFFATVEGLGGDGLVPVSTLGAEYFRHDAASHSLVGVDSGEAYTIGRRLKLRLAEANPISGALRFELPEGANHLPIRRDHKDRHRSTGRRGRPPGIRHQGRK